MVVVKVFFLIWILLSPSSSSTNWIASAGENFDPIIWLYLPIIVKDSASTLATPTITPGSHTLTPTPTGTSTPTQTVTPEPQDGNWYGQITGGSGCISFDVGGVFGTRVEKGVLKYDSKGILNWGANVDDCKFEYIDLGFLPNWKIYGVFTSSTQAEGTWEYKTYPPNTEYASGSWSASPSSNLCEIYK